MNQTKILAISFDLILLGFYFFYLEFIIRLVISDSLPKLILKDFLLIFLVRNPRKSTRQDFFAHKD